MIVPLLLLLLGLVILLVGGDIFVKGAASLSKKFGVSPMVIGLTVVAFGTSAPELIVTLLSATSGASDIAFGNILGSNIANIFFVLGVSSVIRPLVVKKGTAWKEIPFSILAIVVLYILANDTLLGSSATNIITRGDGLILISFFLIFLYYTFGLALLKNDSTGDDVESFKFGTSALFILGGIICLTLGGKLMVDNGIILARIAGLSELLIGLTITALGTSLPELATSAVAAYRGQVDIAIGNVVGSNIFNVFWVLGFTPIISQITINGQINFDLYVALGASMLLFIFMVSSKKGSSYTLKKGHGIIFILLYLMYTINIVMRG